MFLDGAIFLRAWLLREMPNAQSHDGEEGDRSKGSDIHVVVVKGTRADGMAKPSARVPLGLLRLRHQHGVNHMDDSVRLHHVDDCYLRHSAFCVR